MTIHNKVSESFIEGKENKKNKKQRQQHKEDNATTSSLTSLELPQPVLEDPIRSLVPAAVIEVLGVAVGVVTEIELLGPVHAPAFLQQPLEEIAPAAAPLEADGAAEEVEPRVAALQREPRRGGHAASEAGRWLWRLHRGSQAALASPVGYINGGRLPWGSSDQV